MYKIGDKIRIKKLIVSGEINHFYKDYKVGNVFNIVDIKYTKDSQGTNRNYIDLPGGNCGSNDGIYFWDEEIELVPKGVKGLFKTRING